MVRVAYTHAAHVTPVTCTTAHGLQRQRVGCLQVGHLPAGPPLAPPAAAPRGDPKADAKQYLLQVRQQLTPEEYLVCIRLRWQMHCPEKFGGTKVLLDSPDPFWNSVAIFAWEFVRIVFPSTEPPQHVLPM